MGEVIIVYLDVIEFGLKRKSVNISNIDEYLSEYRCIY
jgi:hypothetical protein